MQAVELLKAFEEKIGSPYTLWPDGGFFSGSPGSEVRSVMLCWQLSLQALKLAAARGCDTILCHEWPFFNEKYELPPYRWLTPQGAADIGIRHPNEGRRALIAQHSFTVVQAHYGWDRYCMFEAFSAACGLTKLHRDRGWESVFDLGKEIPVGELASALRKGLNITGTIRVTGDLNRKVRRIANLWGGMGLSGNIYWVNHAIQGGAEAAIAGEMDECFMSYVQDADFPVIETSHQLSEEFGVRTYAAELRRRWPNLPVHEFSGGRPYQTI